MSTNRLQYLLDQYTANISTPEEVRELFDYIRNMPDDTILKEKMSELWKDSDDGVLVSDIVFGLGSVKEELAETHTHVRAKRKWLYAAAAAVFVMAFAGWYFVSDVSVTLPVKEVVSCSSKKELVPGSDKAVLTLGDGRQIVLDDTSEGTLTEQGDAKVIKLDHGQLSYNTSGDESEKPVFNTISTPRGGQYQIVLSDGSKVWLNSASTLHFPVFFQDDNRKVTLVGEAYFEIAQNKEKPFLVVVDEIEVQVLGTHFNVNAYNDEGAIKTTLLEGKVKVKSGQSNKTIIPGQQASVVMKNGTTGISVQDVDVNAVIAWKNGRFIFKGDDIYSVMRQLGRWYDANVTYEENVTNEQFVGVINRSRFDSIPDILEMLEKTGAVSFSVQGNNIKVMPYQK